jgi:hypothetical protein
MYVMIAKGALAGRGILQQQQQQEQEQQQHLAAGGDGLMALWFVNGVALSLTICNHPNLSAAPSPQACCWPLTPALV